VVIQPSFDNRRGFRHAASFLQEHDDVRLLLDTAAAAALD